MEKREILDRFNLRLLDYCFVLNLIYLQARRSFRLTQHKRKSRVFFNKFKFVPKLSLELASICHLMSVVWELYKSLITRFTEWGDQPRFFYSVLINAPLFYQ